MSPRKRPSCGIFIGEYLRIFKNRSLVDSAVKMCDFKNVDEFADYIQKILANDINIEVTEKEIAEWSAEMCASTEKWPTGYHPEPIGINEITEIYTKSLAKYIK